MNGFLISGLPLARKSASLLMFLGVLLGSQGVMQPQDARATTRGELQAKGTVGRQRENVPASEAATATPVRARLARRLVLALDGVSYRDVERMQWNGEVFREFFPVSRNVSTFPSISDVSWADIFHTEAPDGYQRYHYSVGRNAIVGGSMSDLGNPIEYERRMHLAFEELGHHLHSYLFAADAAQVEISEIERRFFETRSETDVFYVYMLSTDTLQHTGGDIRNLLRSLDVGLQRIQARYFSETGEKLEILMVSDHGHNHVGNGQRVPIEELFLAHGFKRTQSLKQPGDVVYTTAGILTSLAIFASDSDLDRLEGLLTQTEGVDLVSRVGAESDLVVTSALGRGAARIRRVGGDRYSYEPIGNGDPLQYSRVVAELRGRGAFDEATQSASADEWLQATRLHLYPAAPERLYRGHRYVAKNPAKLLVSLLPGYENADTTVKWMTHFKRRGGTHGSLRANDSLGILLSNFFETQDTTTRNVLRQVEFASMRRPSAEGHGARFYGGEATGWDYLARQTFADADALLDQQNLFLNIWDSQATLYRDLGLETRLRVRVREDRVGTLLAPVRVDRSFDPRQLPQTLDHQEFRLAWSLVQPEAPLEPGLYRLEIVAERFGRAGRKEQSDRLAELKFVVTTDGRTLAY